MYTFIKTPNKFCRFFTPQIARLSALSIALCYVETNQYIDMIPWGGYNFESRTTPYNHTPQPLVPPKCRS